MQQRTPAPRDTLAQVTPDLTYADYARRGFFELVFAVVLVVPVLLAADWLLDIRRDDVVPRLRRRTDRAPALQRLRLYHASYGLTQSRFYALVLLIWMGEMSPYPPSDRQVIVNEPRDRR